MANETNTIETADLIIKADKGLVEINRKTIRLGPVNMKVLLKLVNHSNKVVSRSELFDSVWQNQVISDDTLTKSISEIRTKLGKHSNYKSLILTIPKKGYQWNPIKEQPSTNSTSSNSHHKINFLLYIKNSLFALVSLTILATSLLWLANKWVAEKHLAIVLIPVEANKNLKVQAQNLEDLLRQHILTTSRLRFLSQSVFIKDSPYSLLINNKFNAPWAIEGRIRNSKDKIKYTLSLIDTRTALEVYSQSIETTQEQNKVDAFILDFIQTIEQKLNR